MTYKGKYSSKNQLMKSIKNMHLNSIKIHFNNLVPCQINYMILKFLFRGRKTKIISIILSPSSSTLMSQGNIIQTVIINFVSATLTKSQKKTRRN